jgi:hypothetical protein
MGPVVMTNSLLRKIRISTAVMHAELVESKYNMTRPKSSIVPLILWLNVSFPTTSIRTSPGPRPDRKPDRQQPDSQEDLVKQAHRQRYV